MAVKKERLKTNFSVSKKTKDIVDKIHEKTRLNMGYILDDAVLYYAKKHYKDLVDDIENKEDENIN